jgi:methylglutamate dehydrogenase subunit D
MAEALMQVCPLEGIAKAGRYGRALPQGPGTTLSIVRGHDIASVIAAAGQTGAVAAALKKELGLELPAMGQSSSARGASLLGVQPGHWLAIKAAGGNANLAARLDKIIGSAGLVTSQSHGRSLIRLSGPRARDVLAKGTPVDLSDSACKPGMVAATQIGHVGVVVACTGADSFDLLVHRSFVEGFWLGLCELALEWGYEVR